MFSSKRALIGFLVVAFVSFGLWEFIGLARRDSSCKSIKHRRSSVGLSQREKLPSDREAVTVVLEKLCELNERAQTETRTADAFAFGEEAAQRQTARGIENARRLLPTTKRLMIESLRNLAARFAIKPVELNAAENYANAVDTIVLDEYLGDTAEILEDEPTKIRIGASYARSLTSDDATVMLLGHELTHAAAQNDNLQNFINRAARTANQLAAVHPSEDQAEDLACDFIAEQTTKNFIGLHNTDQSTAERLARTFDYDCGGNDSGDYEHLSDGDTLRAILALDPELNDLILENK